jgi:PAS domain S-box-containing protein
MIPRKVIELVQSTADASYAVDSEGLIVCWNAAAVSAFGRDQADVVGMVCADIIGGSDECGPVCSLDCTVLRSAHERRPLRNFDMEVPTPLGRRWFNVSVLIYSEFGSPEVYAIHVIRQIDKRKRLEILVRDFVRSDAGSDDPMAGSLNHAAIVNASLSEREKQALRLLAHGMTTVEIARQLGISRTTVNNHVQHAMTKLNAHTRLEAIRKAEFAGLI